MNKTLQITLAALFLTLGLILPFMTMQIPSIGSMLLPMHIPVLLCGFVLGKRYGLWVGLMTPILRSLFFSMPPILTAIAMAFELGTYGYVSGMLFSKSGKQLKDIYIALIVSMILGRVVWGIVSLVIYGLQGTSFGIALFISGALTNALPGIILQLIFIPVIVTALKKGRMINE